MAVIPILQYPDPRLKKTGVSVDDIKDAVVQKMIADMFETLYATENCCGLASTQLAFEHPLAITVIDVSEKKDTPRCLINASILERKGEVAQPEGCMSVYPDYIHAHINRSAWVRVEAYDEKGKKSNFEAEDLWGQCIQHELDHLNGMLYIDHLSKLKRARMDKKIDKVRRLLAQKSS